MAFVNKVFTTLSLFHVAQAMLKQGIDRADKFGASPAKQVDEGDVIRTISQHHKYIGHYHTAGVPGRNEIDSNQELYYPAIMKAIVKTGFKGYVAQEFIPKNKDRKGLSSLEEAVKICDV